MPQVVRAIRPMFKTGRWRIFRDDSVVLRCGPEKGLTGRVLEVVHDTRVPEVIVEGRNMRKKKVYIGDGPDEFFVVTMEAPIHYSRVGVLDPAKNRPVRTGFRYLPDGTRVRLGKGRAASGSMLPIANQEVPNPKLNLCGVKDTPRADVLAVTFDPMQRFSFGLASAATTSFLDMVPSGSSSNSSAARTHVRSFSAQAGPHGSSCSTEVARMMDSLRKRTNLSKVLLSLLPGSIVARGLLA